ncbi:MAG: phage holin family protein [Chloroflexi bacterium]|nr:MAG: phage holin family protein [Chloroflexota bacterium]
MKFILRIFINAVAIWVASLVLTGLDFQGNLGSLILVALIFGLVNALIRPIVKLLTFPITLLTLGLFTLVVNALMLMLTAVLSSSLDLAGNFFESFLTAVLGALVISIVSMVLSWILPD